MSSRRPWSTRLVALSVSSLALLLAPSSALRAQASAAAPPTGLALVPRVAYLGEFSVDATATGRSEYSYDVRALASIGPGLKAELAGLGPVVWTAGVERMTEISTANRHALTMARLGAAYRVNPNGAFMPIQLELALARLSGSLPDEQGRHPLRLWGPSAGVELVAPLNRRLSARGGGALQLLVPSHGTVLAATGRPPPWESEISSASAPNIVVPSFHLGLAIRLGALK